MPIIYRSKVSRGLVCIIVGATVIPVLPVMIGDFSWVLAALIAVVLAFVLYLLFSIVYVINGNTLTVRCGFIQKLDFDIRGITKIKNTSSILSAPAASLDRIAVYFAKQRTPLIISPERKEVFIKALQRINPDIIYIR